MRNFWLVPFPSLMSWSPTVPLSTLVWEGNTYLSFRERKARSCTLHEIYWRYGDGLHPWGDLVTMARVHCMLRDGGQVMVGIPVAHEDNIVYNAHRFWNLCSWKTPVALMIMLSFPDHFRCYGPLMLSNLFANFEIEWTLYPSWKAAGATCKPGVQNIFIARKV